MALRDMFRNRSLTQGWAAKLATSLQTPAALALTLKSAGQSRPRPTAPTTAEAAAGAGVTLELAEAEGAGPVLPDARICKIASKSNLRALAKQKRRERLSAYRWHPVGQEG